jgi:hypothetical protein
MASVSMSGGAYKDEHFEGLSKLQQLQVTVILNTTSKFRRVGRKINHTIL